MDTPRYALVSGLHAVALCKDVDGLYAEPAPAARVVHELRGCEPRGELARAVSEAVVEGAARLGDSLHVRTPDGDAWLFTGVRVLGARGDVVTVESDGDPRRSYAGALAVPCGNLVRVSPPDPPELTHTDVVFLGCSPRGALRDALAAGAEGFEPVRYQVLHRTGTVAAEADAGRVTAWDTSATYHGLVDLTVAFPRTGLIPPQRRAVWDLFFGDDGPTEPGTWRRFTGADREEWLDQAARRSYGAPETPAGATYELDGTDVVDVDAFLCALGEAVYGPGRVFESGASRVIGAVLTGCTLVWHHADIARACLGVPPLTGRLPETFQEIVERLRSAGVRVVLA
ncbi:hypothetical protein KV205_11000 [Streptomyces sp. SKN60]|uniref:hypothetical protein n=1 Tax=Streptomyces sp. SKN60 TaxID=2855506 RepID=UPI002245D8DE|nr:hypothetical protein [Streptomyces sp. SKN60]MCX2181057.1 hypothetical protein [Streptomyces sp. SKN60]